MNSEQHLSTAQTTYNGFIGMVKWGTIACLVVATFVVLLISQ